MSEQGLYRRHAETCKPGQKHGRLYSKCDCPIWFDERRNGVRVHHSMRTKDWTAAQAEIDGYIGNVPPRAPSTGMLAAPPADFLGLGNVGAPAASTRMTLAAAIEKFLVAHRSKGLEQSSLDASENTLKIFRAWAGPGMFADQIAAETWDGYRAARLGAGIAISTLAKELRHLRTFWKMAEERGWGKKLPTSTFTPPKEKPAQKKGFTNEEVAAIRAAIPTIKNERKRLRAHALIETGWYSGLAIVDLATLKRSEIDSHGRLIKQRKKTGVLVNRILRPEAIEALAALPVESPTYYFWSGEGSLATITDNLRKTIDKVFELAGVNGTPHKLRHTNARLMRDAGVDLRDAASLLGHKSPLTLEKYYSGEIQSDRDRLDAVSAKLNFGVVVSHE